MRIWQRLLIGVLFLNWWGKKVNTRNGEFTEFVVHLPVSV